jgi:hypothetical protein
MDRSRLKIHAKEHDNEKEFYQLEILILSVLIVRLDTYNG